MRILITLLLASTLAACGGGGGGGTASNPAGPATSPDPVTPPPTQPPPTQPPPSEPPPTTNPPPPSTPAPAAGRVEENDSSVTVNGPWQPGLARWGWSGGSAIQTNVAGSTVQVTFTGNSIRWLGSRGRNGGLARASIDGGAPIEVNTFGRPTDEVHTVIHQFYDLGEGRHTLTITVTGQKDPQADGNLIVVDAFDIAPGTTISHWQETDANVKFTPGWTKSDINLPFSGTGAANPPELPLSAQESQDPGPKMTLPFRGTGVELIGYRGPDAGIAIVAVDGVANEVDMYAPTPTYQPVVYRKTGLGDGQHTLTVESTGRRNPASVGARVVVDAFDIITPGRRYEQDDPSITYEGSWTPDKRSRVWTDGVTATSNKPGSTVTFSFTGTSVSWIGCSKGSAGGTAKVYIDDVFVKEVKLNQNYPIEGYQITAFRQDGLSNGPHKLKLEVVNTNGSYIVVDAFDVH